MGHASLLCDWDHGAQRRLINRNLYSDRFYWLNPMPYLENVRRDTKTKKFTHLWKGCPAPKNKRAFA